MHYALEASSHTEIAVELGDGIGHLLHLLPLLPNGPARAVARNALSKIGDAIGRLEHLPTIDPPSLN